MPNGHDPVTDAIHNGIKGGIRATLEAECYGAAVILIYAGMDTMANLGHPARRDEVTRSDFISWVERYVHLEGDTTVSGIEWYHARCAVLHTYGVESRGTRAGEARRIGYMVGGRPAVRFNPAVSTDDIIVDIPSLAESFFTGIDQFLVDSFADSDFAPVIENRVQALLSQIPYSEVRRRSENARE